MRLLRLGAAVFLTLVAAAAVAETPTEEARRLFRAGRFADAAMRYEKGLGSPASPEPLFELAICYEKLGRDSEAITMYRRYQRLPLALRTHEAEAKAAALEAKQPEVRGAGEVPNPRHVLVPLSAAGSACVRACSTPALCRGSNRRGFGCTQFEFDCARGCPGAKVVHGFCPSRSPRDICMPDRTPPVLPGLLTPGKIKT